MLGSENTEFDVNSGPMTTRKREVQIHMLGRFYEFSRLHSLSDLF